MYQCRIQVEHTNGRTLVSTSNTQDALASITITKETSQYLHYCTPVTATGHTCDFSSMSSPYSKIAARQRVAWARRCSQAAASGRCNGVWQQGVELHACQALSTHLPAVRETLLS
ncbi:hypothetical protein E2C01_076088 [Portunus trituberculatus]|uniref:Uncharacterized protein n=1 Tax=Portunus trituberculatus TaxID=210409 RepID=A0A5B7I7T6_PORTR|nr:hypothetical protein [Portunus trituberculatus]